ncbi:MAG: twin-arginine translocase TatA/TatE family subunit [Euryarchaeota archaeon]|nr:twin-arginine translocase TatA/TatE family subunit [Euryarchaeota archaeon]
MQLMGLGGWEWILIVFVVLLLFGSRKIPDLARSLGRAMGEFQKGRQEIEREIKKGMEGPPPDSTVVKAARELGIPTEGKTEEQLKEEIARRMKPTS